MTSKVETVLNTYRARKGKEEELEELLRHNWPLLRDLGLASEEPAQLFRGRDSADTFFFVELFGWKNKKAEQTASRYPGVRAMRAALARLCESRNGHDAVEAPHLTRVRLDAARPAASMRRVA